MDLDMEPRPIEVKALKNYLIYVKFKNNEEKIYDMKENFKYPFYQKLRDIEKFKNVRISGINIEWESGEDIAPENLYNDRIPISEFSEEELEEE